MEFDVINLSEQEIKALTTIQLKLLRTAQQKKNEMIRQAEKEKLEFKLILASDNAIHSSLYADKCAEIDEEYNRNLGILTEQLVFNMSLNEPTTGDETGGDNDGDAQYIVDYGLTYVERYNIVRDYYLTIEDPDERLALFAADEVAVNYLKSYYNTLYNYLSQLAGVKS